MAAKKRAKVAEKEWYVYSGAPGNIDDPRVSSGYTSVVQAVKGASEWLENYGSEQGFGVQYVYRLVPVKIVRRAGVIVEDVS